MRKNNKGLTLIELVVTIAIIAIFSGVVVSLIGLGSNSYRATSNNAKIQMETQEASDQIHNLIIDANRSVYYAECSVGEGYSFTLGEPISNDVQQGTKEGRTGTISKAFVVCNKRGEGTAAKYQYDVIVWDASSHKIIYTMKEADAPAETESTEEEGTEGSGQDPEAEGAQTLASEENDFGISVLSEDESDSGQGAAEIPESRVVVSPAVLAEDITDFCADITQAESDRIVRFQLFTDKGGKKTNILDTVNLRNRIKVAAPDASFDSAEAADGKISIINSPNSLKAKESYTFSLYIYGDVNYNSVQWFSKDTGTGTFVAADPTLGKLTINDNPKNDTITIYATAKTISGKVLTSNEVTIDIEKPAAVITGIASESSSVILSVNVGSCNLNSFFSWKAVYSDNHEEDIDLKNIKWSYSGNTGISVNESGAITIVPDAGTDPGDSSFDVTATYTEENGTSFTGNVQVILARLDIEAPSGTCYVGSKKEKKAVYKEGGVEVNNVPISVTAAKMDSPDRNFDQGDYFEAEDIGNWTVTATADTAGRNVQGTVSASGSFRVETIEKQVQIVLNSFCYGGDRGNKDYDMLFAGGTYVCSYYNHESFHVVGNDIEPNGNYSIEWEITGGNGNAKFENGSTRVVVGQGDGFKINHDNQNWDYQDNVNLVVDNDAGGFTIKAKMTVYSKDSNKGDILAVYSGSKNVGVANRIEIVNPTDENMPKTSGTCQLEAAINVSRYIDGNYQNEILIEHGASLEWTGSDFKPSNVPVINVSSGSFRVPSNLTSLKVQVKTHDSTEIANGNSNGTLSSTKDISIIQSTYTAQIVVVSNKTTVLPGEEVNLWLKVETEDGPVKINGVKWNLNNQNNRNGSITKYYMEGAGENYINTFSSAESGVYNISISECKDEDWIELPVSASVDIIVSPLNMDMKNTVTKSYHLSAGGEKTLEFDSEDTGKTIGTQTVYVKSKNSNTPTIWTDWNSIPTIQSFNQDTLTVVMSDGKDFDGYDYVMISVELQDKIYNFYVYSVKNNVDLDGNGTMDTYVPGDLDTIRQLSELSSDKDNMQGQRKYSYLYTDDGDVTCELRYSIHSCTGVGNSSENSYGKWFMKRNNHYYRYDGEKWVLFHDGEPKNKDDKTKFTSSYWTLNNNIKLDSQNGAIQNFKFWQYWD